MYGEAIESDLIRTAGISLDDVPARLSYSALMSFMLHPHPGSALLREINPERAAWLTTEKTNQILADIFDLLSWINANLITIGEHRRAKEPKRYPRPNEKQQKGEKIGEGALPQNELKNWIKQKWNKTKEK